MKKQFVRYLEEFTEYLQNIKNYSNLTIKTYKTPIKDAINSSELYEEDHKIYFNITKYRIKIAQQSNKTINKKLSSIRSFVDFLKNKNIDIKLTGANSVKSEQTLPKPIEKENIFSVLKFADSQEKLIVALIYSFGLRISELSNLKIEDINKESIIVTGKGNKQRQIPSNDTVKELLESYIENQKPHRYLFEKNNTPLTNRQLQYKIEKLFKQCGFKATPHQLRHSFATDLLNEGARINDIQELLGHSSLKATGIYTKLNTNTKLKQYNTSHPLSKL